MKKFFKRVAITATVVLGIAFSASAQQGAAGISPYSELTYKNGRVWQNGKAIGARRVREAMYGNQQAIQLYNSGMTLNLVGSIVLIPSAGMIGAGAGIYFGPRIFGLKNEENKAAINKGGGVLMGIGAAGAAVGGLMWFLGDRNVKNSIQLYNSKAGNDVSYQVTFGLTQTGVGLSLRF